MNQTITVEAATRVDESLLEAMARLVPQLSRSAAVPSAKQLKEIVESRCTELLVARDRNGDGRILGTLTLAIFRIPTGVRAWIEDVVVGADARGRGVGEALSREALEMAAIRGARTWS